MDLPAPLAHRIGPFPVAGWLGIGVVGVGAGLIIQHRLRGGGAAAPPAAPGVQLDPVTGQPVQESYGYEAGAGGGGAVTIGGNDATTVTGGAPSTNAAWGNAAIRWAIGQGANPTDADTAVRNYLSGVPITATQKVLLDQILSGYGPPPESVPPITIAGDTTPTAPTSPGGGNNWSAPPSAPPSIPTIPTTPQAPPSAPTAPAAPSGHVAPTVPFPGRVLRLTSPYMTGQDVATWQQGYNARRLASEPAPLNVDGVYGPLSEAAAKAIQRRAGIAVDGEVGPQTWNVTFYGTPT